MNNVTDVVDTSEFSDHKQLAWESYLHGGITAKDVENTPKITVRALYSQFEVWYDRNY